MKSTLDINGRSFAPIKEAALLTTYSRDYITRLAREGKIAASYLGRQWFVDVDSLRQYAEHVALEQEVRKRQLSEERKQERQLREATEELHTLHVKKASTVHARSLVATFLVLGVGLVGGIASYASLPFFAIPSLEVDSARTSQPALSSQAQAQLPSMVAVETPSTPTKTATYAERPLSVDGQHEGILLLPATGEVTPETVPALFSDHVEVELAADGTTTVVPVDGAGRRIGNPIPFVVVPVTESES
jgi:excisionase family DNA binding protein